MSSTLESEDLENVQLVRMEDVQPSRERLPGYVDSTEVKQQVLVNSGVDHLFRMGDVLPSFHLREETPEGTTEVKDEELETCIVDSIDYDNVCVVDNDDTNIGSMVLIHSEEVVDDITEVIKQGDIIAKGIKEEEEDISADVKEEADFGEDSMEDVLSEDIQKEAGFSEDIKIEYDLSEDIKEDDNIADTMEAEDDMAELIIPEVLGPKKVVVNIEQKPKETKPTPDSWPTLEILPGGVINHLEKCELETSETNKEAEEEGEAMYACAKCQRSFKHLFTLVKHVSWHEKQKNIDVLGPLLEKARNTSKSTPPTAMTTPPSAKARPPSAKASPPEETLVGGKTVKTRTGGGKTRNPGEAGSCAPVNGKYVCIPAPKNPMKGSRVSKKRIPKKTKS